MWSACGSLGVSLDGEEERWRDGEGHGEEVVVGMVHSSVVLPMAAPPVEMDDPSKEKSSMMEAADAPSNVDGVECCRR